MHKLYLKYRSKLVRLDKNVVGKVVGYSSNHLILLLEEGVDAVYAFSMDELGSEEFFVDSSLEEDCENCLYAYCDESNIINGKKGKNNKTL